ncbi:hypothetical protein WME97_14500 [Sorangium sp. So ce367]|uniref:hypothetical protein n=1 Tax=Sorangium sp. So ce367 TaxID=3133305 RepID=UPI003F631201
MACGDSSGDNSGEGGERGEGGAGGAGGAGATTGSGGNTTASSGGGNTTASSGGGGDTTASSGGGGDTTASSGGGGDTTASSGGNTTASSGGSTAAGGDPADARTYDHHHTNLADIPASCIAELKSGDFVFHYAHRSHGFQIIVGSESLEEGNATYGFESEYCDVPSQTGVFRMWDGMTDTNLVEGDQYWASQAGVNDLRSILRQHPEIRYSMWAWSFEISEQTERDVQLYLDTLDALEGEFPNVTFIYMTGPADEEYNGVNRTERNQQIRDFCHEHGKILYDFEDLDSYWNGEQHTAMVDGVEIPMEHPHFSVDGSGDPEYQYTHTTRQSCENKARAFWGMMADLQGCSGR